MNMASKVLKNDSNSWSGVPPKVYKDKDESTFCGVKRHELLGREYSDLNFETRFFELEPQGYSSLEYHRHSHTVIVIQGKGRVILEDSITDIAPHDVVYIAPDTLHQFLADEHDGLGFICIVDRNRDRPVQPSEDEIKKRVKNKLVLEAIER